MRPITRGEVRLDTANAARFSASALSTGAFDALPPTQSTIYRCPRRPKRRSSPEIHAESGNVCSDRVGRKPSVDRISEPCSCREWRPGNDYCEAKPRKVFNNLLLAHNIH